MIALLQCHINIYHPGDDSPDRGEEDEALEDQAAGEGRGERLSPFSLPKDFIDFPSVMRMRRESIVIVMFTGVNQLSI